MPTLNIDVNARVERAKRDLQSLDKEVLKISKSEDILEKATRKVGEVGAKEFRKMQSAAVRQAKAVNTSALQFKQLRAQMIRFGSNPAAVGKVTSEFIRFRKEMERGIVGTTRFQKAQDRLKSVLGTTKRQMAATAAATAKANRAIAASASKTGRAAAKGGKSITGLGTTLENLGSTAVLVLGPLSGVGSRLIAFGAIAKRGSILAAGLFSAIAGAGVFLSKAIKAFDELNLSLSKTAAILKATGKEAQITSKFVEEAAARIARRTLANLEDTRPAGALLLVSKGINAGNFEEMLGLAQDVAASGLMDLPRIAKLIARALEDPIANLDAFRRALVRLTPLEKAQVIHLQNIGKGAEASAISINKLKEKFGGVGESQNTGLAGSLDGLGQSWQELLEDMGEGLPYKAAVKSVQFLTDLVEKLVELRIKIRELGSDFKGMLKDTTSGFTDMLKELAGADPVKLAAIKNFLPFFGEEVPTPKEPKKPTKPLEITVTKPYSPPSNFEQALIDANIGIKKSLINLDFEREKVQRGFSTLSPEILNLAQKHRVLDEVVKAVAGDFSELNVEGRRIFNMAVKVNEAFKDLGRKKEAEAIFNNTRTALEKYNKELRRLIFLYDNGYIKSVNTLITKQKELRATLESSTPELSALTSASEKFGDSLADLVVKGENFADGLRSIFKSLVDDITKQFFKLAVINPILDGIFGASSGRPGMGSQGGGSSGLEGAGGLLGMAVSGLGEFFGKTKKDKPTGSSKASSIQDFGGSFGKVNKDAPAEAFNEVIEDFGNVGAKSAERYGETLDRTNVQMGEKGTKAAMDLGGLFTDMASGVASAVGGAIGSFAGNLFADLLGFQHGGSFKVGGSGGKDSQLVAFKASPRERVSVETPGQQKKQGGGNVTYIDARGVDPGQMSRLIQVVKDLDESVEVRAVNATADARDRNPSLFGRIS